MRCSLIFLALLLSTPARADYYAYGVGTFPCRNLLNPANDLVFSAWLGGYVSGVNFGADTWISAPGKIADLTKSVDFEILEGWVKAYCRHNPNEVIADAAKEMISLYLLRD
jgi:hypothetical protein